MCARTDSSGAGKADLGWRPGVGRHPRWTVVEAVEMTVIARVRVEKVKMGVLL